MKYIEILVTTLSEDFNRFLSIKKSLKHTAVQLLKAIRSMPAGALINRSMVEPEALTMLKQIGLYCAEQ